MCAARAAALLTPGSSVKAQHSRFIGAVVLAALLLTTVEAGRLVGQPPAPQPPGVIPQPVPGQPPGGLPGAVQPPANGQPPPGQQPGGQPGNAKPADQRPLTREVINEAIDRGAEYLQLTQNPNGVWGEGTIGGGGHAVGYTALVGIALLETGASPSNPAIRRAADAVREGTGKLDGTYEVALAIMFLDRMRDKRDVPTIKMLAARLIGGQTALGGWGYKLPVYGPREADLLLVTLKKIVPAQVAQAPAFRERPSAMGLCIKTSDDVRPSATQATPDAAQAEKQMAAAVKALPPNLKRLPVFQLPGQATEEEAKEKPDNSNTHFAMLGLWTARRHEVPTERTFGLLARWYRTSQSSDGGWGYHYARGGGGGSPAMTAVALLGLAIGHALGVDPGATGRAEQDPSILKALKWLSGQVGAPTGTVTGRPAVKDSGGLYYFWALERIAVLYDLKTLDDKDWYKWGAEILVCNQRTDGSWGDGGFPGEHPVLNTAFAVLFLKRANLTPDLSKRLIVDPNALATKVTTTAPKPAPAPEPKFDLSAFLNSVPTPAKEEPAPTPQAATTPKPTATPVAESPAPAPKKSPPLWPWLAGGVGLVAVALLGLVFALRRGKKDEEDEDEDEKPKKKGKGKSPVKAGKKPSKAKD